MPNGKTGTRPFDETIVGVIERCRNSEEFFRFARLIEETEIPKNHDAIIAAIDKFFDFPGSTKYAGTVHEIKESILAQKALILTPEEEIDEAVSRFAILVFGEEDGRKFIAERAVAKAEQALNQPVASNTGQPPSSNDKQKTTDEIMKTVINHFMNLP